MKTCTEVFTLMAYRHKIGTRDKLAHNRSLFSLSAPGAISLRDAAANKRTPASTNNCFVPGFNICSTDIHSGAWAKECEVRVSKTYLRRGSTGERTMMKQPKATPICRKSADSEERRVRTK